MDDWRRGLFLQKDPDQNVRLPPQNLVHILQFDEYEIHVYYWAVDHVTSALTSTVGKIFEGN